MALQARRRAQGAETSWWDSVGASRVVATLAPSPTSMPKEILPPSAIPSRGENVPLQNDISSAPSRAQLSPRRWWFPRRRLSGH